MLEALFVFFVVVPLVMLALGPVISITGLIVVGVANLFTRKHPNLPTTPPARRQVPSPPPRLSPAPQSPDAQLSWVEVSTLVMAGILVAVIVLWTVTRQ